MIIINESDIKRIIDFIEYNQLDYNVVYDKLLSKFHILSSDGISFFFYIYNGDYIVVKYDKSKSKEDNIDSLTYEYFKFKTLSQILEQLKYYDDNLEKNYWHVTTNSAEIGFNKATYIDDWYEDFKRDAEYSMVYDDNLGYKYIVYNNPNYSPIVKSPYNKFSEYGIRINKLYFEIHPISCEIGNESYLFKLLANNEETIKEFINYIIVKKKGLKILISDIFKYVNKR